MQRLGIPEAPLLSMFQPFQNQQHYLRTAFGDSGQSYGPSWPGTTPLMGLLQGNSAAVTGWTAASSVIVDTMHDLGYGYHSATAITNLLLQLVCFKFVDDADLVQSGISNYTPASEVLQMMQHALDCWDGLLRATGGALEKSKSYCYLLDYTW